MKSHQQLLRQLPSIYDILKEMQEHQPWDHPTEIALQTAREVVESARQMLCEETITEAPDVTSLAKTVQERLNQKKVLSLRPVINATGVVLHTNLGRAVLSEAVAEHIKQVAMEYNTLEYNIEKGVRGSRHDHVSQLLCELTGCEAAMVVNNNAAAVLLMLSGLCNGRQVVVSRGELIEIGGSFRIPDIMIQGGAHLHEVGTTNRTHPKDYINAINGETSALLKIHPSNYSIEGFTCDVSIEELARLGYDHGVYVLADLGSGCLSDTIADIGRESHIKEYVRHSDVVTFSGDKLLGGPQVGVLVGRSSVIQTLRNHPLARALRVDKLTLAALEAVLRIYRDPQLAQETIPTLAMLTASAEQCRKKAEQLMDYLAEEHQKYYHFTLESTTNRAGGGSLPGIDFPAYGVGVTSHYMNASQLDWRLHHYQVPVVGRIHKGQYLLEVRTLAERHFPIIAKALFWAAQHAE